MLSACTFFSTMQKTFLNQSNLLISQLKHLKHIFFSSRSITCAPNLTGRWAGAAKAASARLMTGQWLPRGTDHGRPDLLHGRFAICVAHHNRSWTESRKGRQKGNSKKMGSSTKICKSEILFWLYRTLARCVGGGINFRS